MFTLAVSVTLFTLFSYHFQIPSATFSILLSSKDSMWHTSLLRYSNLSLPLSPSLLLICRDTHLYWNPTTMFIVHWAAVVPCSVLVQKLSQKLNFKLTSEMKSNEPKLIGMKVST